MRYYGKSPIVVSSDGGDGANDRPRVVSTQPQGRSVDRNREMAAASFLADMLPEISLTNSVREPRLDGPPALY